jgi:hypothetical protein
MQLDITPLAQWVNECHATYLRKTKLEGKFPPSEYAPVWPFQETRAWTLDNRTDDPVLKVRGHRPTKECVIKLPCFSTVT